MDAIPDLHEFIRREWHVHRDDVVEHLDTVELSYAITRAEILEEQRVDDFCQTFVASLGRQDLLFFEDEAGVLSLRHPCDRDLVQVVLPGLFEPVFSVLPTTVHSRATLGRPGFTIV